MEAGNLEEQVRQFTREDFESKKAFDWLDGTKSEFERVRAEQLLKKRAGELGVIGFSKLLQAYQHDLRSIAEAFGPQKDFTEFSGRELDLYTKDWTADDSGVFKYCAGNAVIACPHPIMITGRLRSVETGAIRYKLSFRPRLDRPWRSVTVPATQLARANEIVSLAELGVSVVSGPRAQALAEYLRDLIDLNPDKLPEVSSVSRLGWCGENFDTFCPFSEGLTFDGAEQFKLVISAVRSAGSFQSWVEVAKEIRSYSLPARIALAASFASVLVGPLHCLPFFVHLWSPVSGTGKTVAQMLAASVWADPSVGGAFFQTFRSTSVGVEMMAGVLHSLPVILDELQLARDRYGKIRFNVYELASGAGKLRSNRSLGLDKTPRWANCFITSGESPLVAENDGAGALNRVLDIGCTGNDPVIRDGQRIAETLTEHYGHAGEIFVRMFTESNGAALELAKERYHEFSAQCAQTDATSKQAMAAALILTADSLATEWVFLDNRALTVADLEGFLRAEGAVDVGERGYRFACDWIAANEARFRPSDNYERFGVLEDDIVYINRNIWNKMCRENGFDPRALLASLNDKGKLITRGDGRGFTRTKKINGIPANCVWLRLPGVERDADEEDELPL